MTVHVLHDQVAPLSATLAALPSEDIVILPAGTAWQVPWELLVHGPFTSCGLLDGPYVRHLTVTSLLTSAVGRHSSRDAVVTPGDHPRLPVFAADMSLLDAAVRVVETGWELAVVLDHDPRVITARSVYRALAMSGTLPRPVAPTREDRGRVLASSERSDDVRSVYSPPRPALLGRVRGRQEYHPAPDGMHASPQAPAPRGRAPDPPGSNAMIDVSNQALVARTMVQLADTLVGDFDLVELLTGLAHRCVDTLGVSAAGVMLATPEGDLRALASSDEAMRMLELFELQSHEGPCLDCYTTGRAVTHQNLDTALDRWPRFAPQALDAGFAAVQALPMHHGSITIGALNLFHLDRGAMREIDLTTAQAFADVATIAILQHRTVTEARLLNQQLTEALTSRIVIEQAKGIVAERRGVDMQDAFALLRAFARASNLRLADVCRNIVDGELNAGALEHSHQRTTTPRA